MALLKSTKGFLALIMLCVILGMTFGASSAMAQTAPTPSQKVTVVTRVLPPFVTKQGDELGGFSAELWSAIARDTNLATSWREVPSVSDILTTLQAGQADLAIAAISITSQREEKFDFSQPMFESGLQIMVRSESDGGISLKQLWGMLTSGAMPWLLGLLAALILIPAHLVWVVERGHGQSSFSSRYFPGIFQATWWATGAAVGQQLDYPRSAFGRAISAVVILVSVIFVAYFTAAVTSAMTVQQLKSDIEGPEDLPGKRVGVTTGSTAAAYMRGMKMQPVEFAQIGQVFKALEEKQIDAIVFDAPVLLYHAATVGKGKMRVVGPIFRKENYGIAFPQNSPLRKRINESLLKLRENGTYDAIYNRWFSVTASAQNGAN